MSNEKKQQALEKSEKNIRRRVYDALNVQFAAGVLQKKDKYIMPNFECPIFIRIYNDLFRDQEDEIEIEETNTKKKQRKVQFAS